jgi:UDP-glucose 4-epimerase
MKERCALVTGATGFIGRHLVTALQRSGWQVVAGARTPAALPPGISFRAVDVTRPTTLRGAADGCSLLVHLVGLSHRVSGRPPTEAEFKQINVEGTHAVLEEALRAGVGQLVHMSSVKAVGKGTGARPLTESDRPAPDDAYGYTKLEAEKAVQAVSAQKAIWTAILRPPMVYGPGNRGNLPQLIRLLKYGVPLPFGRVRNARSMIYIENLVSAVLALIEAAPRLPSRRVFYVADDRPISTPELLSVLGSGLGRPARLIAVPVSALIAAAKVGDRINRLSPFPFTSDVLEKLIGSLVVDDSALRRSTTYQPRWSIDEALRHTALTCRSSKKAAP